MRTMLLSALALLPFLAGQSTTTVPMPQNPTPPAPVAMPVEKADAAVMATQKVLDEQLIETSRFPKEVPLAKFLDALESHLPKGKKIALRIDNEAFGNKLAEVASTPIHLPLHPRKISLRRAFELVCAKTKAGADYRVEKGAAVLTTPERALYTAEYDIRDIVDRPQSLTLFGIVSSGGEKFARLRTGEPAQKAAMVVEALIATVDPFSGKPAMARHDATQVVNGVRLVIRANSAMHAQVADLLQAFRRAADLAVFVRARLFEVDQAFFAKLKKVKRLPPDEEERRFLAGLPLEMDSLLKLLKNQKAILTGDEIKVDNGLEVALASRHQVITCLPGPDQVRKGETSRQTVLEGVTFLGAIEVSPDRRFVRLKLTEKSTVLEERRKSKAWTPGNKEVDAEIPFLREATHSRILEIPDGGNDLVPVRFRAESVKDRFWVLAITCRIYIAEEERQIRAGNLHRKKGGG